MSRCLCAFMMIGCLVSAYVPKGWARDVDDVFERQEGAAYSEFWRWIRGFGDIDKSYALVIGIGDYTGGFNKLESPYHDAVRVKDFFLNEAEFDRVYLLTDGAATVGRINELMEEIIPNVIGEHDRFLFYFSGHGTQRQIGDTYHGYLVLAGAAKEQYGKMISMNLIEYWDSLLKPKRQVLFVLDACFSGLAGVQIKSALSDQQLKRLSQYGHHLITAGSANEESVASMSKWGGSLFTTALIQGASGRADTENADYGRDGIISLKELAEYITKRIDEASATTGGIKMSPQLSRLQADNVGEFFFADRSKSSFVPYNELAWLYGGEVETYGPLPDISEVPKRNYKKFLAVGNMIKMLNVKDPPIFAVVLFRYYIEGEPYSTSMLTVSQGHTVNIHQTLTGFECDAFFSPEMLTAKALEGKEPLPNGSIPVRMRVDLDDIMMIVGSFGRDGDEQINLL